MAHQYTLRDRLRYYFDQTIASGTSSLLLPEYGDIHRAGHDGGDFLFVRQ